ncbi:hypothetical protein [Streptomyces sp. NPDC050848]|uniref:hypothetical protein n=1 Tax=Streptomyces sp. NPDC050848 TaxID=3155791 RepID=UPI00340AB6D7
MTWVGARRTKIRTISGLALPEGRANYRFTWSAWVQLLYHQQTKNLPVSYSPKKLGFF